MVPCAGDAARFLEDFKVPKDEYLLSNAANSVLGRELIQMAQRRGTKLINVVRRREVVAELHKLGCAGPPRTLSSACPPRPATLHSRGLWVSYVAAGMRCRVGRWLRAAAASRFRRRRS